MSESDEERFMKLSRGGIESLDTALTWAVQVLDRDFKGASFISLSVEQMMSMPAREPDATWSMEWTAVVTGTLPAAVPTGGMDR